MRKLLNTLFVTTEDAYAVLDEENIVLKQNGKELGRFPLHILESIYLFNYAGASPALMGKCVREGINLVFMSPKGRFLARTIGESNGNVLLRREQYRVADSQEKSCLIARNMIFGKIYNCRQIVNRIRRDHPDRVEVEHFHKISEELRVISVQAAEATDLDSLRGLEGAAATIYFDAFDDFILRNKDEFRFTTRNRRPPMDNTNALLSFVYTMLGNECASSLEAAGFDAYVGFLHRDRPGRISLALDMLEELRPCMADRFVLSMINNKLILPKDFERQENGAVLLTADGRKKVQKEWQERKKNTITHPYTKEKIPWGMVPYLQALLLARFFRGDLDGYPPFLWK